MNLPFTNPNNQVDPGNNIAYDLAGNVTTDNQGQTYIYDAEERISSMTHLGGTPTVYKYDAEGNLVYERGPDTAQIFLRNTAGQPILIFSPDGVAEPFWNIEAYVDGERLGDWDNGPFFFAGTDAVGTKRFVTWGWGDVNTGAIPVFAESSTSLPFGDALSSIGYDPTHFTGKMRDIESGNDYFGARYYSSAMGRFMSPDWAAKPEAVPYSSLDNPQSLNLYSYVQNNPLSRVDADGHFDIAVIEDGPTEGNPIGHTAIAITGKGVFSFGTLEADKTLTKLGGSTTDFLQNQSGRRDQTITIIKTTPEQDQAAADALMKQDAKGAINKYPDNCSARSNAGLDAAGIPQANVSNPITPMPADPSMPGTAGARAMDTPGSQTITIPKGGQFHPR